MQVRANSLPADDLKAPWSRFWPPWDDVHAGSVQGEKSGPGAVGDVSVLLNVPLPVMPANVPLPPRHKRLRGVTLRPAHQP